MSRERWLKIESIFARAVEQRAEQRKAFLEEACGGDQDLLQEVWSLLEAHEESGILDRPWNAPLGRLPGAAEVQVPGYQILGPLGRGGMGIVYKARDTRLDRLVALKFLPPHLHVDGEARERFLAEAQAAASLDHPNICTIHEIGEAADGRMFIVMPFYQGQTLRDRIARGPLDLEEAVGCLLQVMRGLTLAHESGIIHRDVKPANIILTGSGLVKLMDFGLAKLPDVTLTRPGTLMGTVTYMSPEQLQGQTVDHRTDIWALGVVLYEALAGRPPFQGDHEQAVLYSILHNKPPPLAGQRSGLPAGLDTILAKTLAKDPKARYPSVPFLAADLEQVLSEAEPATLPPSRLSIREPSPASGEILPEGERVNLSILVSRISGYAEWMERLDPEAMERVLARVREWTEEVVQRHGGLLNEFSGGQMVSLFGITGSHEEHWVQAGRAALELHDRFREVRWEPAGEAGRAGLCSGIETGTLLVRPARNQGQGYLIAGETAQAASRLADQAASDEILVGPEHQSLGGAYFETRAVQPLSWRDLPKPITPFLLVRASALQSRLEIAELAGLTPLTGRSREIHLLQESLERAKGGEGQVVLVTGEAGLGKSRLLYEFRRGLDRGPLTLLEGRCQSYGTSIPYLPFIEALKQALSLEEAAAGDGERVSEKIRQLHPQLENFLPIYLHLLSLSSPHHPLPPHLEGEDIRVAIVDALCGLLTLSSKAHTLILVLEDWHWSDEASGHVLDRLAELVSSYPMLLVVTTRPELTETWSLRSSHTPIRLAPLDLSSSTLLIRSLLGAEHVERETARLLFERTGGNPFFLEEICKSLLEEGSLKTRDSRAFLDGAAETLQLPDTVQALIRSRLQRIDPRSREILHVCAVIGREFSLDILGHASGHGPKLLLRHLEVLKEASLVQQTGVLPQPTFRFKHALTQEVVYQSLLQRRRKEFHGRVGRAMEELYPDRTGELSEILAHHFSEAERWDKAVDYGRKAALRAESLSQFSEALALLQQVETSLLHDPDPERRRETLIQLLLEQERLAETVGDRKQQQHIIERLFSLVEEGSDPLLVAEVHRRQGDLYTLVGEFQKAEQAVTQALTLTRAQPDSPENQRALRSLGFLRWKEGKNAEALEVMQELLQIHRKRKESKEVVGDLVNLANIRRGMAQYEEAMELLREANQLAGTTGNPSRQAYIYHCLGTIYRALNDVERALEYLHRAREVCESHRLVMQLSYNLTTIAHLCFEQGKLEESLKYYRKAVEQSRKSKYAAGLSQSLRILGEVLFGLGQHDESLSYLQEAADLFAGLGEGEHELLMRSRIASVLTAKGDLPGATTAWRSCLELARRHGKPAAEMEALTEIGSLLRKQEAPLVQVLESYQQALEVARRQQNHFQEAKLHNSMGIVFWERENYPEALRHYEAARRIFHELNDPVHEGLLLNSIGVTLHHLGENQKAHQVLQKALSLNRKSQQRLLEAHSLSALADLYRASSRLDEALEHYSRSLQIRREIEDGQGEGWMLLRLAQVHALRGESTPALDYLQESKRRAQSTADRDLEKACEDLRSHLQPN